MARKVGRPSPVEIIILPGETKTQAIMRETVRQFALDEATAIEHSAPGFCEETRKDVGYVERIETMWADMLMKRWAHVEQLCLRYNVIL